MECRLTRLPCGPASRHPDNNVRDIVAVTIGIPDGILIGSRDLPGNIIADRRPLPTRRSTDLELTGHSRGAGILQFRARGPRPRVAEAVASTLHPTARTKRLNHRGR